ncbi:ketoacyl-ACP synthase III [Thermoleptolyngbya sichuanensis A183]|uniref:Beta-ketoacyl-[acyl-carrier-protein] synthase III n=1 Tax=Thermoleptolyngbya sichuanensis A183 TaxID=2737172 RepID=A0A6M8BH96_9CYAN|nr:MULTISPECIES: beta-ketoacyl-ACP synthase III [Thermoleptolyngbya]QKD82523.1 ketoacyl-ACP synthase III [Thermoleptolyngbya sichuanensis A183]
MAQRVGAGVAITGSGSSVPERYLDNEALSRVVDTSDEWIASRTGIRQRRLADAAGSLRAIATQAAQNALDMAGVAASEIDLIVLATSTPDDLFGSASQIQHDLGATQATAFDLTAACSGFVFGLVTAAQFIQNGVYRKALIIGADVLSRWVDWSDRRTCVLFGDGAGAVVMEASERDRLLGFELRSDGTLNHCLNLAYQGQDRELVDGVAIAQGTFQPITMNGQEVYRFAVKRVPEVIEKALFRAELTVDQIDWLVMHQANQRILDAVAERLGIPSEKVISNMASYGNTSAASIPLALDEAVRRGDIKPDDIIATAGFGAGLTWGAAVFRWGAS